MKLSNISLCLVVANSEDYLEYKNGLLRVKLPLEKEEKKDIMIKVK